MNKTDNLYEVSEIKNQFEKLQKKYQTQLPKVDPYLVYDLLLRQQENPATIYMYNIEVFTKQGIDTNAAAKKYAYKKTDMVPAVYDKGTHYVTNQKLSLEILKEISDCEEVLQVRGEYTGCCSASMGTSHKLRNLRNSSEYNFYG
jgi:ribonuclease HIII